MLSWAAISTLGQISPVGIYSGQASNNDKIYISFNRRDLGAIYLISYGRHLADLATISLTPSDTFSFVTLGGAVGSGSISGTTITGTINGVSFAASRDSFDGPTRAIAANYFGTSFDPYTREMSTALVSVLPKGELLFLGIGTSSYDGGIGTISPTGQFHIPTLAGDVYTGVLDSEDGVASGQLNVAGYGALDYTLVQTPEPRFRNISTRAQIGTGDNVMIAGFIVADYAKLVYIRVLGPSLAGFGVPSAIADCKVDLFMGQSSLASNDDWGTNSNVSEIHATGSPPIHPKDCALLVRLEPGAYTAVVSGVGGATGVALVEVNEVR